MAVLILLAILLVLSAFFSGSETALFSLRRETLRAFAESHSRLERLVASLMSHPRNVLITILFGNLVVNVTFYGVAGTIAWTYHRQGHRLAAAVLAVAAPLIVIIFGEVAPKAVGLADPHFLARLSAFPLWLLRTVITPIRVLVLALSRTVIDLLVPPDRRQPYVTTEELKMLVDLSRQQGVIDDQVGTMMQELVDFAAIRVHQVMVPRVDLALASVNTTVADFLHLVNRTHHTRIPVYDGTVDNVIGLVHAREILLGSEKPLRVHVRPVLFVPESKTIESLLSEFRQKRESLAMVVDEYGGIAGMVTLEDIIEEIVGEIRDEYDRPTPPVEDLGENTYLLSGRLGIGDWGELFDIEPEESKGVDTLAGFVAELFGRLPAVGESVTYGNLRFTVESMQHHRIERVRLQIEPLDGTQSPESVEGQAERRTREERP